MELKKHGDSLLITTVKSLMRLLRKSNILLLLFLGLLVCFLLIVGCRIITGGNTRSGIDYSPLILDDVNVFPVKSIASDASEASATSTSCTFFDCFDVYRCGTQGNKLLVYVYPPKTYVDSYGKPITEQMSREFYAILKAIVDSRFYTPNPREACIFIPSIDTLNQNRLKIRSVSQALRSLEL